MSLRPATRLLLVLSLVTAACSSGEGSGGPATADSAVVFQGFQVRWERTTHRLNKLGAGLDDLATGAAGPSANAVLLFEGGSFSTGEEGTDSASFEIRASSVSGGGYRFLHGTLPPLEMRGSYATGGSEPAQGEGEASVDVGAGAASATVILRSFALDTDLTHEFGYTTTGFGTGVRNIRREGSKVRFDYWARIEAGSVPDRDQDLESYGATATIDYTVVLSNDPAARAEVAYSMGYPEGVFPDQPRAPAETQAFRIQGAAGPPSGFVALEQFEFKLNEGTVLFPGRYLRETSVRILEPAYDPSTGRATGFCDGYYSNSGAVSWPLSVDFRATLVLVQGRESGEVAPGSAGGPVVIPTTTLPFPGGGA